MVAVSLVLFQLQASSLPGVSCATIRMHADPIVAVQTLRRLLITTTSFATNLLQSHVSPAIQTMLNAASSVKL